jgi:hypothetical protein
MTCLNRSPPENKPSVVNLSTSSNGIKSSKNIKEQGLAAGQKIAKISAITLVSIGGMELVAGHVSSSVVVTAADIDSISDAVISIVVWLGLKMSTRKPARRFDPGYHKVETRINDGRNRNGSHGNNNFHTFDRIAFETK